LNKKLLHTEVQEFIKNYKEPISKLAFSGSRFQDISVQELMQQIESRQKVKDKLPTFFSTENIYYPPKVNLEQTSSEITAQYKASIVSGESIADITGGFGVDSFYFSKTFKTVAHYEHDSALSKIATHNFKQVGVTNITTFEGDGLASLQDKKYDVLYVDPSRRHNTKGKVFFLNDCEPNIPENLQQLFNHAPIILIKTSPMLDLAVGLRELDNVQEIHIVAINNEVKELLWLLKSNFKGTPEIKTINFNRDSTDTFDFTFGSDAEPFFSEPLRFLYEPNAAILKSGAFNLISEAYKVKKLHKNTHLYTSEALRYFPGRCFTIKSSVQYSKKEMKAAINFKKANITTRNFPESVATLRKKWKLADGGGMYLFFTTNIADEKVMLICEKI